MKKLGAVGTVGTGRTGTGHMMDGLKKSVLVDSQRTASLGGRHDGPGLLASPQSGVGLQEDAVGGGCFQAVDLLAEGGLADCLLQLCTVCFCGDHRPHLYPSRALTRADATV